MKLLQNILVPTDFSESSIRAIEASIEMAKKFNSKILLLNVSSEDDFSKDIGNFIADFIKEKLKGLKDKIEKSNVTVSEVIIEKGVAFEKIIEVAQDRDVNVIVVGSGNKSEADHFKLGTTVEKIMQKNQIPLWVVKNEEVKPIRRILCPVDFSDASRRALTNAITLAQKFNAELSVIHVFVPIVSTSVRISLDIKEENKSLRNEKYKEFSQFLDEFDFGDVHYKKQLLMGIPDIEINKAIKNQKSDLLLMGTTGKTILSKLLMGSTIEKVTRELPCSFITTKSKDITDNYLDSSLKEIESILNPANAFVKLGKYEDAIEKYLLGIKQYPDNIPMLKGIIEAYKALGDTNKVNYYEQYVQEVIKRIWGNDLTKYLSK